MQARRGVRRRSARLQALGRAGADLISALPDDLLLLILAHLPCVSAAARTGVLSRRWRSLWPRLRQIVFRVVPLRSLEAALGRFPRPPTAVSLLGIRVPKEQRPDDSAPRRCSSRRGMNRIRHATRRLKITLQRTMVNNAECPFDCPCEPEGLEIKHLFIFPLD
ncbi:hypothetical protein ZWY2020_000418 [Hordeum vulgare]|nr:hypothetical protein ZWY2020_000418 [Hordeum vulgare]